MCPTGLTPGFAPRTLLQIAVPCAASVMAHAAVVATLRDRETTAVAPVEPSTAWIAAPEEVNLEPASPTGAEEGTLVPVLPAAPSREPFPRAPGEAIPERVNLPPPDAAPGAHAGTPVPLVGKARADWWAAAERVPLGPLDSRDGYDALRAQIAGWNPKLITGSYVPGRSHGAHADETAGPQIPAAITTVILANASRFRVCHGVGLPLSATVSGQVLVAFVLEPDGHVSGARDAGGTFPDDAVRRCVVRAVTQLPFPKPPGGVAQPLTVPVALEAEEAVARER
jgi:hypothetical protein